MTFMAAYLLAPAPVVPQGLVSLSPMGDDTAGQPFSAFSSSRSGGSEAGGRSRLFRPASPSSWSVTHSSHPTPSLGNAHRRPDPDPCEHVFPRALSYGSGRVPFYGSPCRVLSSVGYGGRPGGQDAGSVALSSSSYGRAPHLGGGSIAVGSPLHSNSPSLSEIFHGGDLIPLTTSRVQARTLCSGGAARLSPLSQFTMFLYHQGSLCCILHASGDPPSSHYPPSRRPLHSPADQDDG